MEEIMSSLKEYIVGGFGTGFGVGAGQSKVLSYG